MRESITKTIDRDNLWRGLVGPVVWDEAEKAVGKKVKLVLHGLVPTPCEESTGVSLTDEEASIFKRILQGSKRPRGAINNEKKSG